MENPVLCSPPYHCRNRKYFLIFLFCFNHLSFDSFNTIDQIQSSYSSLMMLITAAMVPISPFQPLCDGGCPNTGEWRTPHRVRDGLTILRGLIRLIGNGINLATSTCNSQFCLKLRKEAEITQQIGVGCSLPG